MSRVVRKPAFCICENKDADQLRGYRAFVFATRIVESLYFLNTKFQVSSHILWLYSPVCVGPGRNPRRPVFSQRGSNKYSHVQILLSVHVQQIAKCKNCIYVNSTFTWSKPGANFQVFACV